MWIDRLVAEDDIEYVPNLEEFQCPVCLEDVESMHGMMLRNCHHNVCM